MSKGYKLAEICSQLPTCGFQNANGRNASNMLATHGIMTAVGALQLLKQTRGNPDTGSAVRAWQLFLLTGATAPPSKDFVGLISEYVHGASHNEVDGPLEVRAWALRTWSALKRSAKAGTRRSVRITPLQPGSHGNR